MSAAIKAALSYETIKLITVTNWKLGLIFRSIQILVIIYIIVYALIIDKGYQKSSRVEGVLFSKTKGVAFDQSGGVFDAGNLVVPPTEPLALFIATRQLNTVQTENTFCPEKDKGNTCTSNADCKVGATTSNGAVQPECNTTVGYCMIKGWCPVENDDPSLFENYKNIENWTIYLRTHVSYPVFDKLRANNADKAQLMYNIFPVSYFLATENFTEVQANGAIINVKIDWSCNLDDGVEKCRPKHTFSRIGAGTDSAGFNFRTVTFVPNPTGANVFPQRIYTKYYGIRFIFEITGTGRKFDFAATIVTIGSGAAFLGFATIITDFIIQHFHPHKEVFEDARKQRVELRGQGGDVPSEERV